MNDSNNTLFILQRIHEELAHELKSIDSLYSKDVLYTNYKIYIDAIKLAHHGKERILHANR